MTVANARPPASPWFTLSSHKQQTTNTAAVAIREELPIASEPRVTTLFARVIVCCAVASRLTPSSQRETGDKRLTHKEDPIADNKIRPCARTRRAPSSRIRWMATFMRPMQGRGRSDVRILGGGGCLTSDTLTRLRQDTFQSRAPDQVKLDEHLDVRRIPRRGPGFRYRS